MVRHLPVLATAAVILTGCGPAEPYQRAPVSGRVTVNGKPYAKIAIMFQPDVAKGSNNPGPGSSGITDADGRYTLKVMTTDASGAVVGKHQVKITNYTEGDDPFDDRPQKRAKPAIEIPGRYGFQGSANLTFDVPRGGTAKADFDLKAP